MPAAMCEVAAERGNWSRLDLPIEIRGKNLWFRWLFLKGRPKMTAHESELADLRKKLRDAEMEQDIQKRGHFHLLLERSESLYFRMGHANEF